MNTIEHTTEEKRFHWRRTVEDINMLTSRYQMDYNNNDYVVTYDADEVEYDQDGEVISCVEVSWDETKEGMETIYKKLNKDLMRILDMNELFMYGRLIQKKRRKNDVKSY